MAGSCKTESINADRVQNPIPETVRALAEGFKSGRWASHIEPVPIPSKQAVVDLIEQAQRILFPVFLPATSSGRKTSSTISVSSSAICTRAWPVRSAPPSARLFRHDQACTLCNERSYQLAASLIESLPSLRSMLESDIEATLTGDPAAATQTRLSSVTLDCLPP